MANGSSRTSSGINSERQIGAILDVRLLGNSFCMRSTSNRMFPKAYEVLRVGRGITRSHESGNSGVMSWVTRPDNAGNSRSGGP